MLIPSNVEELELSVAELETYLMQNPNMAYRTPKDVVIIANPILEDPFMATAPGQGIKMYSHLNLIPNIDGGRLEIYPIKESTWYGLDQYGSKSKCAEFLAETEKFNSKLLDHNGIVFKLVFPFFPCFRS